MRAGYLIIALFAAAAMFVETAHSAPAATEEMRSDSGAAIAPASDSGPAPGCVAPERSCWPDPRAAASANPPQPGAAPPADGLAPPRAFRSILPRAAPRAAAPLSILFRNFRS